MKWLDSLERKYGKNGGIQNITRYMVVATLIGQFMSVCGMDSLLDYISFSPDYIFRGQIWRLVTWIFLPCRSSSFWAILFMVCLLLLGRSLEYSLGSLKMNIYFIGGILISDIGGILVYFIFGVPVYLTLYYVLFSLYLMLGLFMPDSEVRLYFVLPIRMKWMMIFYAISLTYEVFYYFMIGYRMGMTFIIGFMYSTQILMAILNLALFVRFCCHRRPGRSRGFSGQNRTGGFTGGFFGGKSPAPGFQKAEPRPGSKIARHKCCICGRTEITNPEMMFRFCSKCTGNKEYCEEHLYKHNHQ